MIKKTKKIDYRMEDLTLDENGNIIDEYGEVVELAKTLVALFKDDTFSFTFTTQTSEDVEVEV